LELVDYIFTIPGISFFSVNDHLKILLRITSDVNVNEKSPMRIQMLFNSAKMLKHLGLLMVLVDPFLKVTVEAKRKQ